MKRALRGMMVICLLLVASGSARAKDEGQIVGMATDPTAAVIPNVTVTAAEPLTNFTRTEVIHSSGHSERVFQHRKGDL